MFLVYLFLFGLMSISTQSPLKVDSNYQHEFESFIQKFERVYKDDAEKQLRFKVFVENLVEIAENAKSHPSAEFGITKFADWTKEEKAKVMGIHAPKKLAPKPAQHVLQQKYNLPESFDWRQRNMVTPVKDQGSCGSCWTFQAVAVLESHILLSGGKQTILSEQEIVDCDHIWGVSGCEGGTSNSALTYVQRLGLDTEKQYPYKGIDQTCHARYNTSGRTFIKEWTLLNQDENNAAYQLTQLGPLGYNIWVPGSLFSYKSGVYYPSEAECLRAEEAGAGHAITIVGFGTENGIPYWLIKNSWGTGWGDQGYFKIHRGNLTCSINYVNPNVPDMNSGYFLAITY
uniref:Uncharacterized protein n=1 Tax=Acrobeloides nanus TaxID=290746 RepID=A0A914DP50_9BILA